MNIDVGIFGFNPMAKLQYSGTIEYSEMILKPSALVDTNAVYDLLTPGSALDKEFLEYGDANSQVFTNNISIPSSRSITQQESASPAHPQFSSGPQPVRRLKIVQGAGSNRVGPAFLRNFTLFEAIDPLAKFEESTKIDEPSDST